MIAVILQDTEQFTRFFSAAPFSDRPSPWLVSGQSGGETAAPAHDPPTPFEGMRSEDATCGLLGEQQQQDLITLVDEFIEKGLFPTHPKRVLAALDGELSRLLVDESHAPVAEK